MSRIELIVGERGVETRTLTEAEHARRVLGNPALSDAEAMAALAARAQAQVDVETAAAALAQEKAARRARVLELTDEYQAVKARIEQRRNISAANNQLLANLRTSITARRGATINGTNAVQQLVASNTASANELEIVEQLIVGLNQLTATDDLFLLELMRLLALNVTE